MKPVSPELAAAVRLLQSMIPPDCDVCQLSVQRDGRADLRVENARGYVRVGPVVIDTLLTGVVVELEREARDV